MISFIIATVRTETCTIHDLPQNLSLPQFEHVLDKTLLFAVQVLHISLEKIG